jgi:class 3 adenylate cyclase/ketosteroid isomerase-like protein
MACASCGQTNPEAARFCGGCGAPLAPRCPACGAESAANARFCIACGSPLGARPDAPEGQALRALRAAAAGERKVVTIVFADLAGSTALHERLDAESTRAFMDRYYRVMQGAVEGHGGTVTQLLGDGVKAVFGAPRVAEDDALRAVRAAVEMQRSFRALAAEQSDAVGAVGLRVAVNTGEVVAQDETEIIGDPVNVAARLQQEARDGDVLVGESTQRLVGQLVTLAPFGTFTLKGRTEPVSAYRVVSLERPVGAPAIAFVGRADELGRLLAEYDAACAGPAARLAVILGSPGLGKSRLLDELGRRLGHRATVLTARCDAAGGATFAPIAEALRALLDIDAGAGPDAVGAAIEAAVPGDAAERTRIADGVAAFLAGMPASPEETFFAVRRLLAALAVAQPVVLAIDDLQWAEPLLLDLVEHLVQWGAGAPLLVLVAARPELREARSSLTAPGGLVADVVTLAGLDAGAATRLAANVIGADALPAGIAGRVLATSEGNPLFVGELVRMLVHEGALKRDGDRWTADAALADLSMPPTIHALLAARIERLRPEERIVLERAAVVGRQFSRTALAHLLPWEISDLDARLEALRRSELVEPDTGWFLGEPALRFHHGLIRDAAYRRLLKHTRAELHERFADWLEARVGESIEHEETLGWHLEQAHQHLRELGPLDSHGGVLGERAARHLAAAGRRALARDDLLPAASLLERALDRLSAEDPARADLALDWCEALLAAGDVGTAARAIAELGHLVADSDRLRAWHTCFGGQLAVLTDPKALRAIADAVAPAAETLAAAGDAVGEAKAHAVHALVLAQLGKIGACEAALDRALAAARRAHDRRRANAVLAGAPVAALWGPSPVTRASGRCLDVVRVLRITQGAPAVEAVALCCQAVLETLRGRGEAARRMIAWSRDLVEELGITQRVLEADLFAGLIELLDGDARAAERWLRNAWDGLRAEGLGIDAAQAGALLARALLAQGRIDEAEEVSCESETLAGDSFKAAIAWRGVRAEVLAARGEHGTAVEVARAAVEIAAATDDLLDHADARASLAVALRAAGRGAEADAEEQRAVELWEGKGATLLVERMRREAPSAGAVRHSPGPVAPVRRVRANAVTRFLERVNAAIRAGDFDAVAALHADDVRAVHHRVGLVLDREELLAWWRLFFGDRGAAFPAEPIAALGDSLLLYSQTWIGGSADPAFEIGPFEQNSLGLAEVDAEGRATWIEVFGTDHLADAVARLYERHAELLPEGPERERAAAIARSVAAWNALPDGNFVAAVDPSIEAVDHRNLGTWSVRGVEEWLRHWRAQLDLTDVAVRDAEVLALEPGAFLVRRAWFGADRVGGGIYEHVNLALLAFGADGLLTRVELFDLDRDAEALARFEALTAEPPALPFANAASRAGSRFEEAVCAQDSERFAALLAPEFRNVDHRPMLRTDLDRQQFLASFRPWLDGSSRNDSTSAQLATRGDRLVLMRICAEFVELEKGMGPIEIEFLQIWEVDTRGRIVAGVGFDLADLDAAYEELDARYLAGEAAPHARVAASMRAFADALARRDWDALAAQCAPDLAVHDHRRLGWETLHGPAAYVAALRALVDLAPDTRMRLDHVELREDGYLVRTVWVGTRDGGPFEEPSLMVGELDHAGRVWRFDAYDLERLDTARARLAELRPDPLRIPPTAATRAADRWHEAAGAGDRAFIETFFAPALVFEDRRRGFRTAGDREMALANDRVIGSLRPHWSRTVLATAGDRLALWRSLVAGTDEEAPFEVEFLQVVEVDCDDRLVANIVFDPDDRRAASVELLTRFARSGVEPWLGTHLEALCAIIEHDVQRLGMGLSKDFVFDDHRRVGPGRIEGRDAFVAWMASLFEESPDAMIEPLYFLAIDPHGVLVVAHTFGTLADGGPFENVFVQVMAPDCVEPFELDDLERARERFAELRPDPLRIPPNAATRAFDRVQTLCEARDWATLEALCAPALEYDDRRRGIRTTGDRNAFVESCRLAFAYATVERTVLAAAGDRLALEHCRWTGMEGRIELEVEGLILLEVDAEGRLVADIGFDPDDRRAASLEMSKRFRRGEGQRIPAAAREAMRALLEHDFGRLRAVLPDDFVFHDHRRTGLGRLEGGAAFVASMAPLAEQAPDFCMETLYTVAVAEHGMLDMARVFGTLAASGGALETVYARLGLWQGDRLVGIEFFEPQDLELARARLEALRPGAPAPRRRAKPDR